MPNVEYIVQENAKYPGSYLESLNIEWEKIKNNYRNPSEPITIPTPDYNKSEKLVINQEYVDMYNKEWLRRVGKQLAPLNSNAPNIIPDHPQDLDDMIQAENARLDAKEQSYQNMQFGKQRVLQLNQNFQERTSFFNWILFVLFLTFILTVIFLYLGNTFPDYGFIFSGMMFIIIISGVGYAVYLYISFLKRNPMNFDEIQYLKSPSEIKADNESKITAKTGEDLLNTSNTNTSATYCTGPECCDTKDMTWDAGNNICVDNGPNYIYGMTTPGTISGNVVTTPLSSSSSYSDTTPPTTTALPTTTAKPKNISRPDLKKRDVYLDKTDRNFVINVVDKNKFTLSILHVATAIYTSKDTVRFYLDGENNQEVINKEYYISFEKDENNNPIEIPFRFSDFRCKVIVEVPESEILKDYEPIKKIDYKTPGIEIINKSNKNIIYYCYQSYLNAPPKLIDGDEFISTAGANIIVSDSVNFTVDTNGKTAGGFNLSFTSMDGIIFNSSLYTIFLFTAKVISYHNSPNYKINGQAIEITPIVDKVEQPPIVFTYNGNPKGSETFTNMNQVESFESLIPSIQINQYKIYPTLKNKNAQEISTYQPKPSDSPFLEYKNFTNNLFSL